MLPRSALLLLLTVLSFGVFTNAQNIIRVAPAPTAEQKERFKAKLEETTKQILKRLNDPVGFVPAVVQKDEAVQVILELRARDGTIFRVSAYYFHFAKLPFVKPEKEFLRAQEQIVKVWDFVSNLPKQQFEFETQEQASFSSWSPEEKTLEEEFRVELGLASMQFLSELLRRNPTFLRVENRLYEDAGKKCMLITMIQTNKDGEAEDYSVSCPPLETFGEKSLNNRAVEAFQEVLSSLPAPTPPPDREDESDVIALLLKPRAFSAGLSLFGEIIYPVGGNVQFGRRRA